MFCADSTTSLALTPSHAHRSTKGHNTVKQPLPPPRCIDIQANPSPAPPPEALRLRPHPGMMSAVADPAPLGDAPTATSLDERKQEISTMYESYKAGFPEVNLSARLCIPNSHSLNQRNVMDHAANSADQEPHSPALNRLCYRCTQDSNRPQTWCEAHFEPVVLCGRSQISPLRRSRLCWTRRNRSSWWTSAPTRNRRCAAFLRQCHPQNNVRCGAVFHTNRGATCRCRCP